MTEPFLPVYRPDLSGREREYLLDAFDSSWISSQGEYLTRFERAMGEFLGTPHVAAVSNGTVALHLALHCLDLRPGDEVIVPSFTYIASVNAVVQAGGTPVFAEVRDGDWQIDPAHVEALVTPRTRAIVPVHLYGVPCDMRALGGIAQRHGLAMVEDCAEALGATIDGRHVGLFGTVGTFSFFGNKTVTTGEGGLVATTDPALIERMKIVKGQGQDPQRRYWHVELGFNYRMTNLCAALGLAQIERVGDILDQKARVAGWYREALAGSDVSFPRPVAGAEATDWIVTLMLPPGADRDAVAARLMADRIETRPVFNCAHEMPVHRRPELSLPVSESLARRGLSLPSYPALTRSDVERVCRSLRAALG